MHRIYIIIQELSIDSASNTSITIANAMAERGILVGLIVVGEQVQGPGTLHRDIEVKFLGIKPGKNFISRIAYVIRAYFLLSTYLAKIRCRRLLVWGKEFTALAEIIRVSLPLRYKLIGINVTATTAHLHKRNILLRKFLAWYYKVLLNGPEHIIAQSQVAHNELKTVFSIPENKITAIYTPMQDDKEIATTDKSGQNAVTRQYLEVMEKHRV